MDALLANLCQFWYGFLNDSLEGISRKTSKPLVRGCAAKSSEADATLLTLAPLGIRPPVTIGLGWFFDLRSPIAQRRQEVPEC